MGHYDEFVFRRLLDEVYLLLDFVSGRPDKSITELTDIHVPTDEPPPAEAKTPADGTTPRASPADIITHISTLRFPPDQYQRLTPKNAAFLLLVKDRLNRMASPAIGMTVAFTSMVVGSPREPSSVAAATSVRKAPSSRLALAAEAYPGLISAARWLRWNIVGGISFMLLLTLVTAYTSGVVSFGRALLERLDELDRSRAVIAESIKSIENAKSAEPAPRPDVGAAACIGKCTPDLSAVVFRLCDRPAMLHWRLDQAKVQLPETKDPRSGASNPIPVFENPVQRQVCDEQAAADVKRQRAFRDLIEFEHRFLFVYERPLSVLTEPVQHLLSLTGPEKIAADAPNASARAAQPFESPQWVATVLAALGNYFLPMCFTLLGTGVSIVRDIYEKVRESTLAPRDTPLSFGRLALGMVAGAAIGLFYSPTQVPLQGSNGLTGSLTLSSQGLAFLAGYGVDSVFAVFDALLRRIAASARPPEPSAAKPA